MEDSKQAQTQQPQPRLCPRDCKQCALAQQVYCSAQLSFSSFEVMNRILTALAELKSSVDSIASANAAEHLANPLAEEKQHGKQTKDK